MFSIIIPGRPCLTDMATVSEGKFAFNFPVTPHFSHIVVFMLPGNVLPDGTAAGVHMQLPGEQQFRFLGAIANEKPSAIFKVNLPSGAANANNVNNMMMPNTTSASQGSIALGISVEPVPNIQAQLEQLKQQQQQATSSSSSAAAAAGNTQSNALVVARNPPSTKVLAQRIIKNAFNFLAGFAGGAGGQEVVPLKSFEGWWKKFEQRIENDPGFLERDED